MASRPATPEDFVPTARPAYAGAAAVTVVYYRAQVTINLPLSNGAVEQIHRQCEHLHHTPEQADACAARLARAAQREVRAAFTPCACHGATPSYACASQTEPLRFWCPDDDPHAGVPAVGTP